MASFLIARGRHKPFSQPNSDFTGEKKIIKKSTDEKIKRSEKKYCVAISINKLPATSQASYLQYSVILHYLAHVLFTLMKINVYKRSKQNISLVRLVFQQGGVLETLAKGDAVY